MFFFYFRLYPKSNAFKFTSNNFAGTVFFNTSIHLSYEISVLLAKTPIKTTLTALILPALVANSKASMHSILATACNLFKNGKTVYRPYRTAKIGSKNIAVIGIVYRSANGAGSYNDGI